MSPQSSRLKAFVRDFGIFISAALVVAGWALTSGWTAVNHHFVHADSFAVFQQGLANERKQDKAEAATQFNELKGLMLRMDTSLKVCIRHQDTCR